MKSQKVCELRQAGEKEVAQSKRERERYGEEVVERGGMEWGIHMMDSQLNEFACDKAAAVAAALKASAEEP